MQSIEISRIKVTESSQARMCLNSDVIDHYKSLVEDGIDFPPVTVFFDGGDYWLADGFHRVAAFKGAGASEIPAEVRQGTTRDAKLYALSANHAHGLPRTVADKRNAVMIALSDEEWKFLSTEELCKLCQVSPTLVKECRRGVTAKDKTNENRSQRDTAPQKKTSKTPKEVNDLPENFDNPADYSEKDHEIEQLHDSLDAIAEENQQLRDAIATGKLSEVEQDSAAEVIESLRKEVKTLTATLSAVSSSRDSFMNECAELKKQCAFQRKQLEKAKNVTA